MRARRRRRASLLQSIAQARMIERLAMTT